MPGVESPVPPFATASVPPIVKVPEVVIGPPVNVRPVTPPEPETLVTVPTDSVAHVGTPPETVRTWPAVPMARFASVFMAEEYNKSPVIYAVSPVPPLVAATGAARLSVTAPEAPPPVRPVPAVTPVISPAGTALVQPPAPLEVKTFPETPGEVSPVPPYDALIAAPFHVVFVKTPVLPMRMAPPVSKLPDVLMLPPCTSNFWLGNTVPIPTLFDALINNPLPLPLLKFTVLPLTCNGK